MLLYLPRMAEKQHILSVLFCNYVVNCMRPLQVFIKICKLKQCCVAFNFNTINDNATK